jgi:hypothetical protein
VRKQVNTASLEVCKELYKMSRWKDTDYFHQFIEYSDLSTGYYLTNPTVAAPLHANAYPAYDLGYLLRKLPDRVITDKASFHLRINKSDRFYSIFYDSDTYGVALNKVDVEIGCAALTPEDAACKLAIELFKQGILKREEV